MKLKLNRLTIVLSVGVIVVVGAFVATNTSKKTVPSTLSASVVSEPISSIATPATPIGIRPVVEIKTKLISYTVMKPVYENHQKEVNYTVMKPVYETREKTVVYTVCTMVPEVKTKTVNYTTCRMERETKQKTVEYNVVRYEPIDDQKSSAKCNSLVQKILACRVQEFCCARGMRPD